MRATTTIVFIAFLASRAGADIPIHAQRIMTGLDRPLFLTSAPGDDDRLYVVEQGSSGTAAVKVFKYSTGTFTNFMTVTGLTNVDNEQGLLGMAFDPNYATTGSTNNGYFYLDYTTPGSGGFAGVNNVARYHATSADSANESSKLSLITINHPAGNHNGGWLGFGPDDHDLYVSVGDGGDSNDTGTNHTEPNGNAQDLSKMLGKLLRIDVSGTVPNAPGKNYAVPSNNPFVSTAGAAPEIWAYGLRNPWRPSFDRQTHDLYIADVGQDATEEVDFQPANSAGGVNYGWRKYEGSQVRPNGGSSDDLEGPSPHTPPITEYSHDGGSRSITGGYVYRGTANDALNGIYFYADFVTNQIWSLKYDGVDPPVVTELTGTIPVAGGGSLTSITSFGEDNLGRLYIVNRGGNVFRLDPALSGDANQDGVVDAADLGILARNWQQHGGALWANADFTDDGNVDINDLMDLATHWAGTPASLQAELTSFGLPAVSVPEPTNLLLGLLIAGAVSHRPPRRPSP